MITNFTTSSYPSWFVVFSRRVLSFQRLALFDHVQVSVILVRAGSSVDFMTAVGSASYVVSLRI